MIGWKVGFGSPAGRSQLCIERPLVARLPDSGRLPDGAAVSIGDWTRPVVEAEVAVWVGSGLGVAIELADIAFEPDDVDRILRSGIYHRHVIAGPARAASLDGVRARVSRNGVEVAFTDEPTALTGALAWVLESVALHAERDLQEGEFVIAGSVVPPLPAAPGERWRADFGPLGSVEVELVA